MLIYFSDGLRILLKAAFFVTELGRLVHFENLFQLVDGKKDGSLFSVFV